MIGGTIGGGAAVCSLGGARLTVENKEGIGVYSVPER